MVEVTVVNARVCTKRTDVLPVKNLLVLILSRRWCTVVAIAGGTDQMTVMSASFELDPSLVNRRRALAAVKHKNRVLRLDLPRCCVLHCSTIFHPPICVRDASMSDSR